VKIQSVNRKLFDQVHLYILNNTVEVIPYISQHIHEMKSTHPRMSKNGHLMNTTKLSYHGLRKTFSDSKCF